MARVVRARFEGGVLKPLGKPSCGRREVLVGIRRVEEGIVEPVWCYRGRFGVRLPPEAIEEFVSERR
ncbi:hypothetical protein Pyrfu_0477 [Pyrolobus fumarii 1A]|uniref:Antitoxin n=1 Tax=Pyrolobus fumarii (strain DSM 11204 / 1A) TaxID=694429 RepID=G0EGH4_PYRF1|nr:antitoxin family protein [Pyrolobus fumarii]AEM38348.1 hypothetical protein Pyrfu_0477 [Pyrolobus fumarii 1A]